MVETLIDRSAEMKEDTNEDIDDVKTEKLVDELRVENDYYIVADTISNDTITICNLSNLKNESIESILSERCDNLYMSDDIEQQLREIKISVESAYNEEYEMFELYRNQNENGQTDSLYIPMRCDGIDDIVVYEIYNEDGEFVGSELENALGEDIYKINTYDLLVDSTLYPNKVAKKSNYDEKTLKNKVLEKNNLAAEIFSLVSSAMLVLLPFIMMSINTTLGLYSLIVMVSDTYYDCIDNMFKINTIFTYMLKKYIKNDQYAEEVFKIN